MLHLCTPWKRFQGVQKCNIRRIWVKRRRVWIPRRLVSWIKRAITESNGINRTSMVQQHCPFLCQKARSEDKWEVIFITNWYPTFCLTFDLTRAHFRGEFNLKEMQVGVERLRIKDGGLRKAMEQFVLCL